MREMMEYCETGFGVYINQIKTQKNKRKELQRALVEDSTRNK